MHVKGLIFDMDGTLIDSMLFWENAGESYLRSKGIIDIPTTLGSVLHPLSMIQTAEYFISNFDLALKPETIIDEINNHIANEYQNRVQLKEGVKDFLEKHRTLPMCVATATDKPLAIAVLERLDIAKFFSFIITSTEVGNSKMEPDIFLQAAERLGCNKEETIVFEDAPHAIETANKAGFYTIAVHEPVFEAQIDRIRGAADSFIYSLKNLNLFDSQSRKTSHN